MNKQGAFYAVGVGPGDPELVTLKALRLLRECSVIAAAQSGGKNMAVDIVRAHIGNTPIRLFDMPMTHDKAVLARCHDEAALSLARELDAGQDVAFITLGDPAVYSGAMYVHARLKALGYRTAMISGVTSFCAAAAALDAPLCERGEALHVLPAAYGSPAPLDGTVVMMKPGRHRVRMPEGQDALLHRAAMAAMVENASLPEEQVYSSPAQFPERCSYFSTVIVKRKGEKH